MTAALAPGEPATPTDFRAFAAELGPALDAALVTHLTHLLGVAASREVTGAEGLLTGGKKIRGALLCLVTRTLGGTLEAALPRATAIELIQTATLIHDDFVDQHRTRRRRPALWTLDGARKAVLLGDVLFASAIHMLSERGPEEGAIVSRAIADIARGAYQEPLDLPSLAAALDAERVDAALYERIIQLKTGVLFGAACQLGALAARTAGVSPDGWRHFGLRVGEAYQIADDLHDVRQYLVTRSIGAEEIAALAPALLCFAQDIRSPLLQAANAGPGRLDGQFVPHFEVAAAAMTVEIERRLRAAEAEIGGQLPANALGSLMREAPRALLALSNAAGAPAALP